MHSEKVMGDKSLQAMAAELMRDLPVEPDAPGYTSKEFAKAWGVGVKTARLRIRYLIEAGKLVQAGTRRVMRSDRHSGRQAVYGKPMARKR